MAGRGKIGKDPPEAILKGKNTTSERPSQQVGLASKEDKQQQDPSIQNPDVMQEGNDHGHCSQPLETSAKVMLGMEIDMPTNVPQGGGSGQWISPKKPLDRSAGDVSGSEIAKSPPPLQSEGSLKSLPSLGLESEKLSLPPSLQSDQSLKPLPSFATELEKPNFAPSFHNECSSKVLLSSGTESVKLNLLSFQTDGILKALPSVDVKSENWNFHPSSETEGSLKSLLNPGAEFQHVSATTTNVPSGSEEVPVLAKRNVFGGSVFGFSDDISPDQVYVIYMSTMKANGRQKSFTS
jgi:hypothetical protein